MHLAECKGKVQRWRASTIATNKCQGHKFPPLNIRWATSRIVSLHQKHTSFLQSQTHSSYRLIHLQWFTQKHKYCQVFSVSFPRHCKFINHIQNSTIFHAIFQGLTLHNNVNIFYSHEHLLIFVIMTTKFHFFFNTRQQITLKHAKYNKRVTRFRLHNNHISTGAISGSFLIQNGCRRPNPSCHGNRTKK